MWTCPRCGEPHEDRFSDCWKCVGAELQTAVSAEPLPAAPTERKLRPFSAILVRAFVGFCVGATLTLMFTQVAAVPVIGVTWTEQVMASLFGGVVLGTLVGAFVWVVFPYEPVKDR